MYAGNSMYSNVRELQKFVGSIPTAGRKLRQREQAVSAEGEGCYVEKISICIDVLQASWGCMRGDHRNQHRWS